MCLHIIRSSTTPTSSPHVTLSSLSLLRALLRPRPSRKCPNGRTLRSSSRSSSRSVTHRARTGGSSSHYGCARPKPFVVESILMNLTLTVLSVSCRGRVMGTKTCVCTTYTLIITRVLFLYDSMLSCTAQCSSRDLTCQDGPFAATEITFSELKDAQVRHAL